MVEALIRQFCKYPLDFISHLFLLLPVTIGAYRQKYLTNTLLSVAIYFAVQFLQETVLLNYTLNKCSSIKLQQLLLILDTVILSEIFFLAFKDRKSNKYITLFALTISLLVSTIDYLIIPLTSISSSLFKLTIILFSLMYFNKILSENRIKNVLKHSMFWISSGFLLLGMGTFFSSLFIDYLLGDSKEQDNAFDLFWAIDQVVICLQCILIAIGLWVSKFDKNNYILPV